MVPIDATPETTEQARTRVDELEAHEVFQNEGFRAIRESHMHEARVRVDLRAVEDAGFAIVDLIRHHREPRVVTFENANQFVSSALAEGRDPRELASELAELRSNLLVNSHLSPDETYGSSGRPWREVEDFLA